MPQDLEDVCNYGRTSKTIHVKYCKDNGIDIIFALNEDFMEIYFDIEHK